MAKFGEGDARWIVNELGATGKNVNGWHWEEKNCLSWWRSRAEAALVGLTPAGPPHAPGDWTRITAVKELKGEASLSTRKAGKKVCVYDLNFTLSWEGYSAVDDERVKGEWKLSEFASANDEDEYVVAVTVEGKGAAHEAHKKRAAGMKREVLALLQRIAEEMLDA